MIDELDAPDSALAKHVLKKWSWGLLSAQEVYEFASKALADQHALLASLGLASNFASKSLTLLAQLGADGEAVWKYEARFAVEAGGPFGAGAIICLSADEDR